MGLFKPKLDPTIKGKMERPGVKVFVSVQCVSGLPVPQNTLSQIYYFDDHLEINAGGVEYNLNMERIQDISIQTDVDTQTQYVSSAGGALLGAAIAGPLGAAVAGRTKKEKTQTVNSCLVISYIDKAGCIAYISFNALYTPKCRDIVTLFQKNGKKSTAVDL